MKQQVSYIYILHTNIRNSWLACD